MSDQRSGGIGWTDQTKWCTACKAHHDCSAFGKDGSRGDGLAARCLSSRHTGKPRGYHGLPLVNPLTGRPGPVRVARRDGDRRQARSRVNHDVQVGLRPRPNDLPCMDCGHVWSVGERRHEYDHYLGYAAEHHLDVQAVCTSCHRLREERRRG